MLLMLYFLAFSEPSEVVGRYQAHVRFLADDLMEGRETSFRGQRLAANYLATQLALAGAEPLFPDNEQAFFQHFDVLAKGIDHATVKASVSGRGGVESLVAGQDFRLRTLGLKDGAIDAPLVFAGYGFENENFDEFQDQKVKGKWVVVLEGQPEGEAGSLFEETLPGARLFNKLINARSKGAAGLIVLREGTLKAPNGAGPTHRFSLVKPEKKEGTQRKMFPLLYVAEAAWPKIFGKDFNKFQERTLAIRDTQKPQSFQIKRRNLDVSFKVNESVRQTENVVAVLPGSDPELAKEHVVISAHYDHIGTHNGTVYNGADDNASGTATLLMIARDLATLKHKRSLIILLVSAEESGLLGSEHFMTDLPVPKEQIVANINMDMIGRNNVGEVGVIPSTVEGISTLNQVLDTVNESSAYKHTLLKDQDRYHKRSDHYNFTKNGIPAIFFFAGVHEDYHGPKDDWQDLNYEKLEKLYGLMKEFVVATLDMPTKPVFLEVPEAEEDEKTD